MRDSKPRAAGQPVLSGETGASAQRGRVGSDHAASGDGLRRSTAAIRPSRLRMHQPRRSSA